MALEQISPANTAVFVSGEPRMENFTNNLGADIPAGAVVVITGNATPMVAHSKIESGKKGALAVGGGTYRIASKGEAGVDGPNLPCWYDNDDTTGRKVTATAGTLPQFGFTGLDTAAHVDGDKILVQHKPIQTTTGAE